MQFIKQYRPSILSRTARKRTQTIFIAKRYTHIRRKLLPLRNCRSAEMSAGVNSA